MKIKDIIKALEKKEDQDLDCEVVIIGKDSSVQMLMLEQSAHNMSKLLKCFTKGRS